MNKEEIMVIADKLLQKWELYSTGNRRYIENMFNGCNTRDMMINIDVMKTQTKMFMLERGTCIWEHRTEHKEVVIYIVLHHVIDIITHKFIYEKYADFNGHCKFTEEVNKHKKEVQDEAFSLMGTPYEEWYRQGVTMWTLNK